MPIRVKRDGYLIRLDHGSQEVNGRTFDVGQSKVCLAGEVFADDRVAESVLERAKAGDPRVEYITQEQADEVAQPSEPESPSAEDLDRDDLLERLSKLEGSVGNLESKLRVEEEARGKAEAELSDKRSEVDRLTAALKEAGSASSASDAQVGAPSAGGSGGPAESAQPAEQYDPSEHNQDEVLEYLKGASPEEVERVKAVEASSGQNRQKIGAYQPQGA